jgi:hypothetical protein
MDLPCFTGKLDQEFQRSRDIGPTNDVSGSRGSPWISTSIFFASIQCGASGKLVGGFSTVRIEALHKLITDLISEVRMERRSKLSFVSPNP